FLLASLRLPISKRASELAAFVDHVDAERLCRVAWGDVEGGTGAIAQVEGGVRVGWGGAVAEADSRVPVGVVGGGGEAQCAVNPQDAGAELARAGASGQVGGLHEEFLDVGGLEGGVVGEEDGCGGRYVRGGHAGAVHVPDG